MKKHVSHKLKGFEGWIPNIIEPKQVVERDSLSKEEIAYEK
tara:strand:- start:266 stop:388 length:123 start_codon:yes stop_codon:yes gene_type:complete